MTKLHRLKLLVALCAVRTRALSVFPTAPTPSLAAASAQWQDRWQRWRDAPAPQTVSVVGAEREWRVVAISDVHTDFPENMKWLRDMPSQRFADGGRRGATTVPRQEVGSRLERLGGSGGDEKANDFRGPTALILAGDVSHRLSILKETFSLAQAKFDEVFYVPGNHELWRDKDDPCDIENSLDKFLAILELCDSVGVHCRPCTLARRPTADGGDGSPAEVVDLEIVPLFSWYSSNLFAAGPDEHNALTRLDYLFDVRCRWPDFVGQPDKPRFSLAPGIAPFFAALNNDVLGLYFRNRGVRSVPEPGPRGAGASNVPRVSFSHFLPDAALHRGRSDLRNVMGSRELQSQVRELKPQAHVFGHSHVPWDISGLSGFGKTRFVQSALGYPHGCWDQLRESRQLVSVWPPCVTP